MGWWVTGAQWGTQGSDNSSASLDDEPVGQMRMQSLPGWGHRSAGAPTDTSLAGLRSVTCTSVATEKGRSRTGVHVEGSEVGQGQPVGFISCAMEGSTEPRLHGDCLACVPGSPLRRPSS